MHGRQLLSRGVSQPDAMPRGHLVEWVWRGQQRDVCGLRGGQVRGDGGIDWVRRMLGGELVVSDGVEHEQRVRAVRIRAVLGCGRIDCVRFVLGGELVVSDGCERQLDVRQVRGGEVC